jgi:hypothetical protein
MHQHLAAPDGIRMQLGDRKIIHRHILGVNRQAIDDRRLVAVQHQLIADA